MRRLAVVFCAFVFGSSASCGGARDDTFRPPVPPSTTQADATPRGDLDFARGARAPRVAADQVGVATWYGAKFRGKKTASGERFDERLYTAAHRRLPFGTWVEVRRIDTGRTVRVKINDRGPFGDTKKVIDLSRRAADELGIVRDGAARVELRIVSGP